MLFVREAILTLLVLQANAFSSTRIVKDTAVVLSLSKTSEAGEKDRRSFLNRAAFLVPASFGFMSANVNCQPASATVYFDPAMYGDQELRQSAVNSLKEAVRRAILQDPKLAPAFYELAVLDGLSFDAATKNFGPDGRVVTAVLSSKDGSQYMKDLQACCKILADACVKLKRMTSVGIADAVALGGVAAIESIGGPFISIQLGRLEVAKKDLILSPLNLKLLSGDVPISEVTDAFRKSGMTEREMTAILGTLLTLETVQKTRTSDDWKASSKQKFREPGKMGRSSDFKALTEQDIADMENESTVEGDDGWYIAESFGSRDEQFGAKIGGGAVGEKTFNKYMKDVYAKSGKRGGGDISEFGWIGQILLDKNNPTTEAWVSKYAGSYLNFNKDLSVAYNAITQLGSEYTGGKYEVLEGKKRKTLNDDDLGLFR